MPTKLLAKLIFFLTLSMSTFLPVHAMHTNQNTIIQCQLSALPEQALNQGTWVTYSLTNTSSHSIRILPWYTPLEGFMSNLFIITDEHKQVIDYQGPMFKRQQPQSSDYISLASQQTLSKTLNLQQVYNLQAARYQLNLAIKYLQIIDEQNNHHKAICQSNSLEIHITD